MAALIVEDGTGLTNADSYATVAYADTYHENRGNIAWDTVADKEAALRKATDFMVGKYRLRWAGVRKTLGQALDWPRDIVPVVDKPGRYIAYYSNTIVPVEVMNACVSLALRAATAELLADQEQRKVSVTVGPISTTYDSSSSQGTKYPEIDNMLRPYLQNTGNGIKMIRA